MDRKMNRRCAMASLAAGLLLVGCVSAQTYDALQKDYQQLQTELAGDQAEITQLHGRLKVTFKADITKALRRQQVRVDALRLQELDNRVESHRPQEHVMGVLDFPDA